MSYAPPPPVRRGRGSEYEAELVDSLSLFMLENPNPISTYYSSPHPNPNLNPAESDSHRDHPLTPFTPLSRAGPNLRPSIRSEDHGDLGSYRTCRTVSRVSSLYVPRHTSPIWSPPLIVFVLVRRDGGWDRGWVWGCGRCEMMRGLVG